MNETTFNLKNSQIDANKANMNCNNLFGSLCTIFALRWPSKRPGSFLTDLTTYSNATSMAFWAFFLVEEMRKPRERIVMIKLKREKLLFFQNHQDLVNKDNKLRYCCRFVHNFSKKMAWFGNWFVFFLNNFKCFL